jgi:hypothetical protein
MDRTRPPRLTLLQRQWLARIGLAGDAGLLVGRGEAPATIRSLQRRGLLRWAKAREGTGHLVCRLTETGESLVGILPRPVEGSGSGRATASPTATHPTATVPAPFPVEPHGAQAKSAFAPEVTPDEPGSRVGSPEAFTPSVGDVVRVRERRLFGRVTAVSLANRRACVCVVLGDSCTSKSFGFDELARATREVRPCTCRDECEDIEPESAGT